MKKFIGTKVVKAEPMTMAEAQKVLGREIKPATVEEDGYLVASRTDISLGLLRVCSRKHTSQSRHSWTDLLLRNKD